MLSYDTTCFLSIYFLLIIPFTIDAAPAILRYFIVKEALEAALVSLLKITK